MTNSQFTLIYIGTAEFGVPLLESLISTKYQPSLVITSEDKPVGRQQLITASPIKKTDS